MLIKKFMTEETPFWLSVKKNKILLVSILPFIITAFFSSGFLHPDEHYQILEIVNLKLPDSFIDLTIFNWDYHLNIRSMIQPFFYTLILYPLKFLSPFTMAFIIRLLNGLLGFYSLFLFLNLKECKKHENILLLLSLTWFIPLLFVRTNAESLSTSLFFIGYYFYFYKNKYPLSLLFFGLTFLVRFQMALLIAPMILFDLFSKKFSYKKIVSMFLVLMMILIFGVFIDSIMYGKFILSSYNYFYQNLVLKKANDFGVEPIYFYFVKPIIKGIPPLSLLILFFGGKFIFKNFAKEKSLYIGLLFFIIIHSLISHKEVRFLTTAYIIITILFAKEWITSKKSFKAIFITINLLIMLKTSLTSAHSRINLYKTVYDQNIKHVFHLGANVNNHFNFTMPFYLKNKIEVTPLSYETPQSGIILTTTVQDFNLILNENKCSLIYNSYPQFLLSFNFFNWQERSSLDALWSCNQ